MGAQAAAHRMDRSPSRQAPPTVIEYHARKLYPSVLVLAAMFAVIAVGILSLLHTTTIACRRTSEYATARCTVDRTGLRPIRADLRAEAITAFDVRVEENQKRRRYAEVRLELAPSFTPRVLDLETGVFDGVDAETALAARDRFERFQSIPSMHAYDASLSMPIHLWWLLLGGGVLLAASACRIGYEQLRQLRPIRIVVDHEREVIVLGGRTVPLADVRDVILEQGVVQGLLMPRYGFTPGFKLSLILVNFDRITATRAWRPGSWGTHEAARERVLTAMGRGSTT